MYAKRYTIPVTTDGAGAATEYSSVLSGQIVSISYVKPGSGNFDNGVDFDVTLEATGEVLWDEDNVNASKVVRPVAAATLGTGAASALTERPFVGANDRIKIVIAAGGAAKVGTFHITIEEPWGGLGR